MNEHNDTAHLNAQLHERLQKALSRCSEKEAIVLRTRFGLDDGRMKTIEQTAEILNISCGRVRQIESKALRHHERARRTTKIADYFQ